jgi:hypothetical protein
MAGLVLCLVFCLSEQGRQTNPAVSLLQDTSTPVLKHRLQDALIRQHARPVAHT